MNTQKIPSQRSAGNGENTGEESIPASHTEYQKLEAAAAHLRKSERGDRALKNLSSFFRDGGTGLDDQNKRAVILLMNAAFTHPWNLPANLTSGGGK